MRSKRSSARHRVWERWVAVGAAAVVLSAAASPLRAQCTDNSQCNDGLFCTANICFNPGPSGQCIYPQMGCSDGLFCNGAEQCDENRDLCEYACVGGTVCNVGFCVCNEPGGCPSGNMGQACDITVQPPSCPGEFCNEVRDECTECTAHAHCATPPELWCNSLGECVECITGSQCQDGSYCTGQETCNAAGECEPGTPVQCPFGEFCSDGFQQCLECENDLDCSDGVFCNGVETCNKTTLECQNGTTVNCKICVDGANDGLNCNIQSDCPGGNCRTYFCSESADACVQCLQNSHCSDVDYCTRNLCIFDACVFEHTNSFCSNGQFCDGAELCVGGIQNPSCNNATGAGCCRYACLGGGTCNQTTHLCVGGSNPNTPCDVGVQPPSTDDAIACTTDSCNEATNTIDHVPNDQVCTNGLFCDGTERCDPPDPNSNPQGCVEGTDVDCSAMVRLCRSAFCDESQDRCSTAPSNVGGVCDDEDPCTAATVCSSTAKTCSNNDGLSCTTNGQCPARSAVCSNLDILCNNDSNCPAGGICGGAGTCASGVCANVPPGANDPYRCVRLEWRNITPSVPVNGTATMDLYAVANNCNVSSQTGCSSNQHRIVGLAAILDWNPQHIEIRPSTIGNLNPEDPCDSINPCHVCPAGQANWSQSFWDDDCAGDGLNFPCTGNPILPANDGDSHYVATSPVGDEDCMTPPPTCVTPGGLFVTRFKFKALRGGTATVAVSPCEGDVSRTSVISINPPPMGYVNGDVLKSIGPAATFTVTCTSHAECNDANPCTTEQCVSNLCQFTNVTGSCNNGLFCDGNNDTCVSGVCTGSGNPCTNPDRPYCNEGLDRCDQCLTAGNCVDTTQVGQATVPNVCTDDACNANGDCVHTPVDCDDGAACTADSCQIVVSPPNVTAVCVNSPNDALCATGQFCFAQYCQPAAGCVPDHVCTSATGNPCPDNGSCDEGTDTCGGCLGPSITAVGGRFLRITPSDQGATPVALLLEGDCETPGVECVSKYVRSRCNGGPRDGLACASDADCPRVCVGGATPGATCVISFDCGVGGSCAGFCDKSKLGDTPDFLTAAEWGTLSIKAQQIRPDTLYRAMADCNFPAGRVLSAANEARTWRWADTNGDGLVNVLDISTTVNYLKGLFAQSTYEGTNVWPCDTDDAVNVIDLSKVVDAVRGEAFPCPGVCP